MIHNLFFSALMLALLLQEGEIKVTFVCSSGTHRSPASARLLKEVCRRDNFKVTEPQHLCKPTWTSRNRCSTCQQCRLDYGPKELLFKLAYDKWLAIMSALWASEEFMDELALASG